MIQMKTISQVILASAVAAISTNAFAAGTHYIACYGVSAQGPKQPLITTVDVCNKLAGGIIRPLPAKLQATAAAMKPVAASDYVQCYGVAAAGKNDCATKGSACGGNAKTARAADTWVSVPKGLCQQIKGGTLSA